MSDRPRCRDCADHDGRCPHDGTPCDPDEWHAEIVRLRAALREIRSEITLGGGEFEEPDIDKIFDFAKQALEGDKT